MARAERINTILSNVADTYKKRGEITADIRNVLHRDWTDGTRLSITKKDARFGDKSLFYCELYELPTLCGQLVLAYMTGGDKLQDILNTLIKEAAKQNYGSIMYSTANAVGTAPLKKAGFEVTHKFKSPRTQSNISIWNLDITDLVKKLQNHDEDDDLEEFYDGDDQPGDY